MLDILRMVGNAFMVVGIVVFVMEVGTVGLLVLVIAACVGWLVFDHLCRSDEK